MTDEYQIRREQIDRAWAQHVADMARAEGSDVYVASRKTSWIKTSQAKTKAAPQAPETTIVIGDRIKWHKYFGPTKTGIVVPDVGYGRSGSMTIEFDRGGVFLCRIAELERTGA
jgi:hypothetical protein